MLVEVAMAITLSAMEARQKFGEILNRVDLVHDQFIIERNGRPLAAIVPISSLVDIAKKARSRALSFLDKGGTDLSDDEANSIAVRAERRKKKSR
jgi:prevent-host-death family protein